VRRLSKLEYVASAAHDHIGDGHLRARHGYGFGHVAMQRGGAGDR